MDDEIIQEFLVESHENLDQLDSDLVALEESPGSRELLSRVFRTIHTVKGTSGFLAFGNLERLTHAGESLLVELRDGRRLMDQGAADVLLAMVDGVRAILHAIEVDGSEGDTAVDPLIARIRAVLDNAPGEVAPQPAPVPAPDASPSLEPVPSTEEPAPNLLKSLIGHKGLAEPDPTAPAAPPSELGSSRSPADMSIRVDVDLLDALMRQVGELVLARNTITRLSDATADVDLVRSAQRLSLIASELQEGVMKTRMQPIEHVWSKVPRMVRDLSSACGRQVRLDMVGGETELDRSLLEAIKDPLTHLIRNAIDHGIESPTERVAKGKPAVGVLTLRAYHQSGQVVVEVTDDGKGIDPEKVAAKAIERELRTDRQVEAMAPTELLQLLFLPGFSTADAVTNVSGRGVGMDVVRTKIEMIGGTVDIESTVGTGTTWRMRIPLTLAIMPALTVECDHQLYAIPQASMLELVALDEQTSKTIEYVGSAPVYRLRGELLPLVDLRDVFQAPARPAEDRTVIAVLQADAQRFGLLIDRVLNTEEIVVKPLSARLKGVGLFAGATLLGDGRVSLILDIQAIGRRSMSSDLLGEERALVRGEQTDARDAVQVLVAGIGQDRRVAIPLTAVTRLERLPSSMVEHVGGSEVVQYRGAITPVVRLGRLLGTHSDSTDELNVVMSTREGRSVAIVVDQIVDIVEGDSSHHSHFGDDRLVGSTVLQDRVTELLDIRRVIVDADPLFFTDVDGAAPHATSATTDGGAR